MPILSICIPTYNRFYQLKECLVSILFSAKGHESDIEIIVSDDASTDNTKETVSELQNKYPFVKYHRNVANTRDGNFYILANLAAGKYIWIFGDDDKIEPEAIGKILKLLESGYNLIICNHSVWSNDFSTLIRKKNLPFERDTIFNNYNKLLTHLGLKLGFISCLIIKRDIFLEVPTYEWEPLLPFGVAFLYSIYIAMLKGCKAYLIASPLVLNRGCDSCADKDWWYKCFVTGSSLIFKELIKKGYSTEAVFRAKYVVLKDYVMHDISLRKIKGESTEGIFRLMLPHYKRHWFFWIVIVPMVFAPRFFIWMGNKVVTAIRN